MAAIDPRPKAQAQPHGFFSNIIMLPKFEQARAKLECEICACCLRARSAFEHRIPQPPAPRGLEQIGPESAAECRLKSFGGFVLQAGDIAGFFVSGLP
jgi:hypothetical protein